MNFRHFFHHLFNPHCDECRLDKLQSAVCLSCETLKAQLEISNVERAKLLEAILYKETEVPQQQSETPQPIKPSYVPWRVRQQLLEENDRQAAIIANNKRAEMERTRKQAEVTSVAPVRDLTVEEIEKELLDASPNKTESAA